MSRKLAVFDVDGTLIDSRASIFRAAVEAAQRINITPPAYDEVRGIVGMSLFEGLQFMRPDLDPETVAAYAREFQTVFSEFHAEPDFHEALYAGAQETLIRLRNENWLIGMATGNSRRGVTRILEVYGWSEVFDVTFCADDGPSKPDPHMLRCNMQALGVEVRETLMIGDATHDIRMARSAGVHALGVAWGFHTPVELEAAGAHEIVDDYAALNRALDRFSSQVVSV